jgi:hypothetical protein
VRTPVVERRGFLGRFRDSFLRVSVYVIQNADE